MGVAPAGFRGVTLPAETGLWVPFPMIETLWPSVLEFFGNRERQTVTVYARLAPGASLEEARAVFNARAAALAVAYPETNEGKSATVLPFQETRLSGPSGVTSYLGLVLGVVSSVLLIACANVSGLRLVELSGREGELATRRALGAGRLGLARLVLVESALLYPARRGLLDVARRARAHGGPPRFAGAFLLTVVVGLLSSLAVVFQGLRARGSVLPGQAGRAASLSAGVGRNRLRAGLVALQVALSSSLLVGTGLIGALERVGALPGVRSAAWSASIPFGRILLSFFVPKETRTEGEPDWIEVDSDIVTPGFLRTMDLPLLQGRDFTDRDDIGAPRVVLVNERISRKSNINRAIFVVRLHRDDRTLEPSFRKSVAGSKEVESSR